MKSIFIPFLLFFLSPLTLLADEGMWLLIHLKKMNFEDMQKKGLKISAEEIYSINQSSIKDAIVSFGKGCTSEVISEDGLLLTNHHCGHDAIQYHSTVESDYLSNGFWAMKREEEKPTPDLSVKFVVRIEDVSDQILPQLSASMTYEQRKNKIAELSKKIELQAAKGNHYQPKVNSFFEDNQFILFIYEVFTDVRLVGAPPYSIGVFGGETDNWMWPRHTGDFALFRIYTSRDGKPASYSPDNIPLKPKYYLPISIAGVKKQDFAMVMGYPKQTYRYLTSEGIRLITDQVNPAKVKLRTKRLAIMKEGMDKSDKVRIQYSEKYRYVSNYWKFWSGESKGAKNFQLAEKKEQEEKAFTEWMRADKTREAMYQNALPSIQQAYGKLKKNIVARVYLDETLKAVEAVKLALEFNALYEKIEKNQPIDSIISLLKKNSEKHFKNFDLDVDQKLFASLFELHFQNISPLQQPSVFNDLIIQYNSDFNKASQHIYPRTIFASKEKMDKFLERPSLNKLAKDPIFKIARSIYIFYQSTILPQIQADSAALVANSGLYIKGLKEMNENKKFYPDANITLRLTYGQVMDYYPRDGVYYNYFTTLDGLMEKEDSESEEYIVPPKLKQLYEKKDYGPYAENGIMHVAFITDNDITGGNSGSPVLNAKGELIGVAFDGNWEAVFEKMAFSPPLQRCIVVDIRYVLFIIDKFAGASHLVKEMKIQ